MEIKKGRRFRLNPPSTPSGISFNVLDLILWDENCCGATC